LLEPDSALGHIELRAVEVWQLPAPAVDDGVHPVAS
jgi:hypothetical protein